jgi:hypothetical protein
MPPTRRTVASRCFSARSVVSSHRHVVTAFAIHRMLRSTKARAAVERELGRLKNERARAPLRVQALIGSGSTRTPRPRQARKRTRTRAHRMRRPSCPSARRARGLQALAAAFARGPRQSRQALRSLSERTRAAEAQVETAAPPRNRQSPAGGSTRGPAPSDEEQHSPVNAIRRSASDAAGRTRDRHWLGSLGFRVPDRACICRNLRQSDSSRTRRDPGSRLGIRLLLAILLSPHTREALGSRPRRALSSLDGF